VEKTGFVYRHLLNQPHYLVPLIGKVQGIPLFFCKTIRFLCIFTAPWELCCKSTASSHDDHAYFVNLANLEREGFTGCNRQSGFHYNPHEWINHSLYCARAGTIDSPNLDG
jgi:hypothetical protein